LNSEKCFTNDAVYKPCLHPYRKVNHVITRSADYQTRPGSLTWRVFALVRLSLEGVYRLRNLEFCWFELVYYLLSDFLDVCFEVLLLTTVTDKP
jgi:hypothetical protein